MIRKFEALGCMMLALALPAVAGAQENAAPARPVPPAKNLLLHSTPETSADWLMYGHDPQRTSWANAETALSKDNVGKLKLLWSAKLSTPPKSTALSTLTSPVVVGGVKTAKGVKTMVYTVGADDTVFAVDADSGKVVWQKTFKNTLKPIRAATWLCSNTEQATPVIDKAKGVIYFTTSDGNLRGAALADGAQKLTPTPFVAPFSRNWSLSLIDGKVYTSTARGCGGTAEHPVEDGHVGIADISNPTRVTVQNVYTGRGRPAGSWSRTGPVLGPQGVYLMTADGLVDPASGMFGSSVIAVDLDGRGVVDSFTPPNWKLLNAKDLDLGSGSPVVFPFKGRSFVAGGAKESVIYLLDGNALGGGPPDHSTALYTTPKLGNDPNREVILGIWGSPATFETGKGDRYLYFPMWGPPSKDAPKFPHANGDAPNGSVMAFQVKQGTDGKFSLDPAWISRDMTVPDAPIVANGVVYAVATGEQTIQFGVDANGKRLDNATTGSDFRATPVGNQILYALDAETGKELFSSGKTLANWDHFNQPVVAHGKVYVVSYDAHVYAFGLDGAAH